MTDKPNRIDISHHLLSRLKDDSRLKAVFFPGAEDQRITRLVSNSQKQRLFELDIFSCNDGFAGYPHKAVMCFLLSDIKNILKVSKFVLENEVGDIDSPSSSNKAGELEFFGHPQAEKVVHESVRVGSKHFVERFSMSDSGEQMESEQVDPALLSIVYQNEQLMGYDELLRSTYQVFAVDEYGNETEVNASSRERVYTLDDEHESYPVSDWQHEVENRYTQLGYNDWVQHQIEANDEEFMTGKSAKKSAVAEGEVLGIDEAVKTTMEHKEIGLIKFKIGVFEPVDLETPIQFQTVVFAGNFHNLEKALSIKDAENNEIKSELGLINGVVKKLTFDNTKLYTVVELPSVLQSLFYENIDKIAAFVERVDGVTVEDVINDLTSMKADYQENGIWNVDNKTLNQSELIPLLVKEICLMSPDDRDDIMRSISHNLEASEDSSQRM